jgi:mRNA interferase MazF
MRRGEVWLINLDPTIGAEIRKSRPAVILSSDLMGALPLRVIIPLTDWKDRYASAPWMLKIEPDSRTGLSKPSSADCFQIRSVSETRIVRKLGELSSPTLDQLVERVTLVLTA